MATKPGTMEKLVLQPASFSHSSSGAAYTRPGYQIEYSPRLVLTGKNYYDSRPTEGYMSTAAEELAIQLGLKCAGQDPRRSKVFDDLFGRNASHLYAQQWTETVLRVPAGRNPAKYETDPQGRKYWAREVLIGNNVIGEILVPEGGRVVPYSKDPEDVWDLVFGLPRVTSNNEKDMKHKNHAAHFWFNEKPEKDKTTGNYDVAVVRGSWPLVAGERCLGVAAVYERFSAFPAGGFRPVRVWKKITENSFSGVP